MAAEKGADLDKLFSFLSDATVTGEKGTDGGGGGKDEADFVDSINQDLDRMIGDDTTSAAVGGAAPAAARAQPPQGREKTKAGKKQKPTPAQQPIPAQPEKSKGKSKFKWKK